MAALPRLSVAVITFNEERNIHACISSVVDLADEIIVLDSFSTDQTQSICQQFAKVTFFQHAFDGHIPQKNRALSYCSGAWILSLDADERLSPELQNTIKEFLASEPKVNGAKFPRLTYHLNKYIRHTGWYPNARFRLIRNGTATWGGENPHDTLIVHGSTSTLQGDLIHYSFVDLSDQINTVNKFSTIKAFTRFAKGQRFSMFRMLFKPLSKFIELYLVKRGFLDGLAGFIIAVSSAFSAFLVEAKIYELDKLKLQRISNIPASYNKE